MRPATLGERGGWLHGLSPGPATVISVVLMACVAVGDDVTGPDVAFTLLYLGPIGFATWFVSVRAGLAISVASAVASFAVDLSTRRIPLPPAILAWNLAVQLGVFLALVALLAALKNRLEGEQLLARTDPLTLVANRRAFLEQAAVEIERARRTGRPVTVAYLDCDDFKVINDRFGHAQGDALLSLVASTLRNGTRSMDVVARLGGDEFGLLLVDTDGPTAAALVDRLRSAVQASMADRGWIVTFSVGACTFLEPPLSVDDMLLHADRLMYDAKRAGKDAARFEVVQAGAVTPAPVMRAG
ncbi:MAG TPA: GGDEF domain-containing protein [Anaeromyxobacteraceae bacterium]|nr:GGDEF domain-containing protein [Anaeromyxobacteraceae bacterium]